MNAQKRKSSRRSMLHCSGAVNAWDGYLFVRGDSREGARKRESLTSLNIEGDFTTAVRGITAFVLRIYPDPEPQVGNADIPSIGVWTAAKPMFDGAVYLSYREFDLVLALVQSGKLASVDLSFQEPHYGKALIASVSFSGDPPEEA